MKSFRHAFHGIWYAIQNERNIRIHLAAVYYAAIAGIFFSFTGLEWMAVLLTCGTVISAELVNTALERLCDGLEPGHSPVVKVVKDLAAGAVLVCAAAAVCVAAALLWANIPLVAAWFELSDMIYFPDLVIELWAGVIMLPFWVWFIFGFGRKQKVRG